MPDGNDEAKSRIQKAEAMLNAFMERLDHNIEAQKHVAESIDNLSDMIFDFMGMAVKYDMVIDGLVEKYTQKTSMLGGKFSQLLQDVAAILEKWKALKED